MALEIGEVPGGGRPWGNVVDVETPALDKVTQQLQQQASARQSYLQKEGQNTSELFNKELANVRSVDMPMVTDLYTDWKGSAQPLYFNKGLQMNPKAYNAAQVEANSKLGKLQQAINQSAQLNQFGKQLATDRTTPGKSNLYADDFGEKFATFMKTPMDQLQAVKMPGSDQPIDLTNQDNFRYKGANNVNFSALEKNAMGTPTQKYQSEEQISPLQKNITPYTSGNTPAQYQESLRGSYSSSPATYRAAAAAWEAIPQQDRDRVAQLYANIPGERWKQMGLSGPQAIAPVNPSDPADQLAAYKAQLYAVNNPPTAGKVYSNVDESKKMGLQEQERLRTVQQQHVNRMSEIAARYVNQKDLAAWKLRATDPEGTTPTVDTIQTLLEHPGQMYNGKTSVQLSQDVLSNWNSQGNNKNVQSKLTVVPSFNTSQTKDIKGFTELHQSAMRAVGDAYNSLPENVRTQTWGTIMGTLNDPKSSPQQIKETLANAYNEINKASGSPVRFTPDDLDKSVPVLHQRREVDDKYDNTKYQVVKSGTPEFENVINEKRNAVLSSKKPVIQGQGNGGNSLPSNSGIKWQ